MERVFIDPAILKCSQWISIQSDLDYEYSTQNLQHAMVNQLNTRFAGLYIYTNNYNKDPITVH